MAKRTKSTKKPTKSTTRALQVRTSSKDYIDGDTLLRVNDAITAVYGVDPEDVSSGSNRDLAHVRQAAAVAFKELGNFTNREIADQLGVSSGRIPQMVVGVESLDGDRKESLHRFLEYVRGATQVTQKVADEPVLKTLKQKCVTDEGDRRLCDAQTAVRDVMLPLSVVFNADGEREDMYILSWVHYTLMYIMVTMNQVEAEDVGKCIGLSLDLSFSGLGHACARYGKDDGYRQTVDQITSRLKK